MSSVNINLDENFNAPTHINYVLNIKYTNLKNHPLAPFITLQISRWISIVSYH